MQRTQEAQYQTYLEEDQLLGRGRLGIMISSGWRHDPRRLLFMLARYKFVAKMLSGYSRVLEIGCGDAFGTRLVRQEVKSVLAVDFDPIFINDIRSRMGTEFQFDAKVHNMLDGPLGYRDVPGDLFHAAYSLDVLEHIAPENERAFLRNIANSLSQEGVLIIGMPSLESQPHASEASREGHVNCKSAPDLKNLMREFFYNVFMFSMNDEVVHTGYHPMAHYLFAVCAGRR